MNKIAIFYHVYQVGDWENMFNQQIDRMKASGLFDAADLIRIGVNGNLPIQQLSNKVEIIYNHQNSHHDESSTIKSLCDFCALNQDYKVLYIHTSGVRFSVDIKSNFYLYKTFWRRYQEYFVIDKWKWCVSLLDSYDCVGSEWKTDGWIQAVHRHDLPHYSGNIWWSKSEYINKLKSEYLIGNDEFERYASEFFIGTGNPNYYNFYSSGRNLYFSPIYEDEYTL